MILKKPSFYMTGRWINIWCSRRHKVRMHTHANTVTAVWAHLFLWQSELIPAWSHRPHDQYKLQTRLFSSLSSLFFFFYSSLSSLHCTCFSFLHPPVSLLYILISVSPAGHVPLCPAHLLCYLTLGFCYITKMNNVCLSLQHSSVNLMQVTCLSF